MARYILYEEESEPDDGCEIKLYLYPLYADCNEYCTVAVIDTEDKTDIENYDGGGFHLAHTCRPHGEKIVEFLNKGASNA